MPIDKNILKDYFLKLSLNNKLMLMMLLLCVSLLSVYIFLYSHAEKAMYAEFQKQTSELSKAIQVGVEEVTSTGITDEKRLQTYLKKLNTRGVNEISIISNTDKIISSTNPKNIGKWITTKRKDLIFKAELGEPVTGEGQAYNVIIPVVAGEKRFGYIHLTTFLHPNSHSEFSVELERLIGQGARTIIFDLQDNPGGWLNQAVAVADEFFDDGLLLIEELASGEIEEFAATSGGVAADPSLVVVVLVNSGSASASELVAGALQDRGRAVVIGESTFGKGTVQQTYELSNRGAVRVTIARWLTPTNRSINFVGIEPDVVATSPDGGPPQLLDVRERALAWLAGQG